MKYRDWFASPRVRLDIVAGVVDGILTALTLAASKLLNPGASLDIVAVFRVSIAAGATTIFVFFLAHYAESRARLMRAERQLNVLRHGRLAAGHLGDQAFRESLSGAGLAAVCSIAGALFPMLLAFAFPSPPWLGCGATIVALGALGAGLAQSFHGSRVKWSGTLMAMGVIFTFLGAALKITG
jgi:VIT1/CCC1 family predicted Fe2+/Mn2+ transporter